MTAPTLDSDIPVPTTKQNYRRSTEYPETSDMQVGQSFLLPYPEGTTSRKGFVARVRGAMKYRHPDWVFAMRQLNNGVRVWRTA